MRYVLALTLIAALGGFGAALASDDGHDAGRATQQRLVSADDGGKSVRSGIRHDAREADEHEGTREHDEAHDEREGHREAHD